MIDVPRSLPLIVNVVSPSVGPLCGEIAVIVGAGHLPDSVIKFVENVAETSTHVSPRHPHWKFVIIL